MYREEGEGRGKRISVKLIAYETNMARTERSEGNGSMPVFDDCLHDGDAAGHQPESAPDWASRAKHPHDDH